MVSIEQSDHWSFFYILLIASMILTFVYGLFLILFLFMLAKSLILFILSIESKIKCLVKKASKFTQTFSFIIIELKILPYNDAILVNLNTYTTYMRRGGFPN